MWNGAFGAFTLIFSYRKTNTQNQMFKPFSGCLNSLLRKETHEGFYVRVTDLKERERIAAQ